MNKQIIKRTNDALKAGIGYTIGNIFIKGINFLTIPIFSRLLTTDEFGIYNVFIAYESIIMIVVGLAIHSSVRSAKVEFGEEIDEYLSSVTLIYVINFLLILVTSIIFNNIFSKFTKFSFHILVCLVVYSFGSALLTLYNNKLSLHYNYKNYLMLALFNTLGNIVLSIFFIVTYFSNNRATGRIVGITIIYALASLYILFKLYSVTKPKYHKKYWKFAIKYSIPIVPHGISQVLLSQFDRIMIRSIVSNSAAGIYSLAANLNMILVVVTESISTAWTTWYYERMRIDDIRNIQQKAVQIVGFFSVFTIAVMGIAPEIIYILGGEAYESGKYVAIPLVINAFILFLYNMIVTAEYYSKKTMYIMLGTLSAAIINIMTNLIFIKRYGLFAAAYTTLFSYICYLILHVVISKKVVNYNVIPIKWLLVYLGLVGGTAGLHLLLIDKLMARVIIVLLVDTVLIVKLVCKIKNSNNA